MKITPDLDIIDYFQKLSNYAFKVTTSIYNIGMQKLFFIKIKIKIMI